MIGEKLVWFRDHLDPELTALTPTELELLILKYLG